MGLTVHFLNVGEGDCTIIEHDSGRISVVDLSNVKRLDATTLEETLSGDMNFLLAKMAGQNYARFQEAAVRKVAALTDALEYYDTHIGKHKDIWRLIVTHPHMDHVSGLHRLVYDDPKGIYNFWHVSKENFDLDSDSKWQKVGSRYDRRDWEAYKALRDSGACRAFDQRQGESRKYWDEDGIQIWAPTPSLVDLAVDRNDQNILSMILVLTYRGRTIVLGGDATADETWPEIWPHVNMQGVDVLKASHHGRNSGYHQKSVKEMAPWLTITSVGQTEHDATRKYRQYSEHTVSMRSFGDIKIRIDDNGELYYPSGLEDHWKDKTT